MHKLPAFGIIAVGYACLAKELIEYDLENNRYVLFFQGKHVKNDEAIMPIKLIAFRDLEDETKKELESVWFSPKIEGFETTKFDLNVPMD